MTIRSMIAASIRGNGEPVVIRPGLDTEISTKGVFASETVEVSAGNSVSYQQQFSITIPGEDAVKVRKKDIVVVHGRRYQVEHMLGDGRLVRRLVLGVDRG